jgi:hypothetical protein
VYLWYERNSTRYDNTARFFLSRKNAAGAGTGNTSIEAGRVCVIVWRDGAPLP